LNIAPQNDANNSEMPEYANVFSPKYGYSRKLPRDFKQLKEDAQNGKLPSRGAYDNDAEALPPNESYREYEVPTPEMVEDLNLPAGTAGPERVMVGEESNNAYYTGSHGEGEFLDLQNGKTLPGESIGFPPDFHFFFW
jgi:hypothetical protein